MAVTASDLRCRITIYRRRKGENQLGETTYDYRPEGTVWAQIVPASGRTAPLAGEVERAELTHRVRLRASACPVIERGMYFLFRGQRYDILYGYPIYNRSGWMELTCRLVVEDHVPGI